MADQVFEVLKHSFDCLDPHHQRQGKSIDGYTTIQQCFLYCSLYPEDYKIPREELINKFILERLVDTTRSMKAQLDQGHSILDKLIDVCLLERTHDHQERECIKLHNLVRAMALKITKGKTMVVAENYSLKEIPNQAAWTTDLEKVSLVENDIEKIPPGMSPNCPKLSTLLLQGNPLKFLPNSFFSRMYSLCILDLSRTDITRLPNTLSNLESLKALLLEKCRNLVYVPYLGKMKALLELNLSGTAIKEVPEGMENLINLKRLSMKGAVLLETLPVGLLLSFPHLQCLSLPNQIEAPVDEIVRLKQLEVFDGRVKDVSGFNRFIKSQQSKRCSASYCVMVGDWDFYSDQSTPDMDYHRVILDARDYIEREVKDVSLLARDIQHLQLHHCEGLSNYLLDNIPRFNSVRSLQTLIISSCEGIECIFTNEPLMMEPDELVSIFPSVQAIVMRELSDFVGVIHKRKTGVVVLASPPPQPPAPSPPPQTVFSSLRILKILGCNEMKKLKLRMSQVPNLKYIFVMRCDEIEEIIQVADDNGIGKEN